MAENTILQELQTEQKKFSKFIDEAEARFTKLENLMEIVWLKLVNIEKRTESSSSSVKINSPQIQQSPYFSPRSEGSDVQRLGGLERDLRRDVLVQKPDYVFLKRDLCQDAVIQKSGSNLQAMKLEKLFVELSGLSDEAPSSKTSSSLAPDSSKAKLAAASMFGIIDRKLLVDPSDESATTLDSVKGKTEPRHVSFKYPSRLVVQIFRDLSLSIHSGRTVTLVGERGSGKSTVISSLIVIPPICSRMLNSVNLSLSASDLLQVSVSLHFIFIYDPGPRISSHFSLPSSHIIEGKMHTWYLIYCFRDPSAFPEIYLSTIVVTCEPGQVKRDYYLYVIAEINRLLPLQSVYCIGTVFSHLDSGLEEYTSYGCLKLGEAIYPIIQNKGCCVGEIPAVIAEDVDLAMAAARRALVKDEDKHWATASSSVCAHYLRTIAAKVMEMKSELTKLEAIDCGKPLDEALWDMDDVAGCFEYYADLADELDAKQKAPISLSMQTFTSHVLRKPIGVVALITLWSYSLLMAMWKVAPALATGGTKILKPSELASVMCLELRQIYRDVGLPPKVLNILTRLGPEAGAPLASHPHVDKIAFTGSSVTRSKIMPTVAQLIKLVSLELGGKSLIVVFEDVDLDKAVEWTMLGYFWTIDQICAATTRLITHDSIAEQFLNRLVKWIKNIKISDTLEEGCRLGPVVSKGQYEKVLKFTSIGKSEGATILTGGSHPRHLNKLSLLMSLPVCKFGEENGGLKAT